MALDLEDVKQKAVELREFVSTNAQDAMERREALMSVLGVINNALIEATQAQEQEVKQLIQAKRVAQQLEVKR